VPSPGSIPSSRSRAWRQALRTGGAGDARSLSRPVVSFRIPRDSSKPTAFVAVGFVVSSIRIEPGMVTTHLVQEPVVVGAPALEE